MRSYALALIALAVACGSKSSGSGTNANSDAGPQPPATTADGGALTGPRVIDQGVTQDYDTKHPLAGVKISEGDVTTTSDAQGQWSLSVPQNTPITLVLSHDTYSDLQWPEVILTADTTRVPVPLVSINTYHVVGSALDAYDRAKGVLFISLTATGSCADVAGATAKVISPAGTTVRYFKYGVPSKTLTAVAAREVPALTIYNVQPNTPVQVQIDHPTCKMSAFPHTDGTITYTGNNIVTSGGDASTLAEFFLE